MKNTLIFISLAAAGLVACGGGDSVHRDQKEYEVVQEGSAVGGTSTALTDPQPAPPLAMTGTNADTTTAFTIPSVAGAPGTVPAAPGSIASTLPQTPIYSGSTPSSVPASRPRVATNTPRPEPAPSETTAPEPPSMTSAAPAPPPAETAAPAQETTSSQDKPEDSEPQEQTQPDPPPPPPTNT